MSIFIYIYILYKYSSSKHRFLYTRSCFRLARKYYLSIIYIYIYTGLYRIFFFTRITLTWTPLYARVRNEKK